MNTGDEGQLRSRLSVALDQLDAGPLPLEAVVRQGRAVMIRRRALTTAALVIVAVAALTVPRLARDLAAPPPSSPTRYHITVNPPGITSPKGLIAYGRVITSLNDTPWSVSGAGSGSKTHLHWHMGSWRLYSGGQLFTLGAGSWGDMNYLPAFPANPVSVFDVAYDNPQLVAFAVRADVSYLLASLSDGQTVTLHPVAVLGRSRPRLVAIAVPSQTSITEISAYSAKGELGYTVPYGVLSPPQPSRFQVEASGDFQLLRWLRPGQPALPRPVTYTIGRGTANGTSWSEQLKVGPWGTCVSAPTDPPDICFTAFGRGLLGGKAAVLLWSSDYSQLRVGWDAIVAGPSVSSIDAIMPNGRLVNLRIYSFDGAKFATLARSGRFQPRGWIAYSAAGKELASDSF